MTRRPPPRRARTRTRPTVNNVDQTAVHPVVARNVERALLGGLPRSRFDSDVLAFVDAVTELAGRLRRRGWTDASAEEVLSWDWPGTALAEEVWDRPGQPALLACTGLVVVEGHGPLDESVVEVSLVGDLQAAESGRDLPPAQLTNELLAELEAYQVGQPTPPLLG